MTKFLAVSGVSTDCRNKFIILNRDFFIKKFDASL